MEKVEKYIQEHTKNTYNYNSYEQDPIPWLTPEEARKVAEIAREETIKEVCEWLDSHTILSEKWYIAELKKHLNDKL